MNKTQKYRGRGQLVKRLAAQVGSQAEAIGILRKRGDMQPDSIELTAKGKRRNAMTASERAKDRAAKASGGSPDDYTYNPRTNAATKKSRP